MKNATQPPAIPTGAYTVKALIKALRILECLAEGDQPTYTLTELSRQLHLHVSTVHRLTVNLLRQGFVEVDPLTGGYRLGFRVLRMGLKVLDRLDCRRVAHPLLRELNVKTQETVHLAILHEGRAISIERFASPHPVGLDAPLGNVMPLHCTGVGKSLLAYQSAEWLGQFAKSPGLERRTGHTITSLSQLKKELARIRERGYAVDNEETVEGLRCVAAPVFDHTGSVVAAFSVAGPATRITAGRVPEIARLVCETSREISYRLGYKSASPPAPGSSGREQHTERTTGREPSSHTPQS
jgi:DNA-binding IclR family transcriptional regulator